MNAVTVAAYAAWLPAVAILFRRLGPARAVPIAVLASLLLLPRLSPCGPILGVLPVNKRTISGLALLLGVLVSDPRALLRARPRAVDLPMIGFLLMPLASSAAHRFAAFPGTVEQLWVVVLEWGLPYLAGRLYFGDPDAPRRLSIAIVAAGLCYVPACLFETVAGPKYYLLRLVYGLGPYEHMVERLGGYRPEVFLTSGIELASWMAMASTVAFWLWLRRGWAPWKLPTWVPALTLSATTIACRGAYGYLILAVGLATAAASHGLRTRLPMVALSLAPPAYLGLRVSGRWDGQALVKLAEAAGSGGSIAYRIRAEDLYVKKTFEHGAAFGYGGGLDESGIFDWFARAHLWADGWWVHQLRASGVIGLVVFWLALFLVPAWMGLALPPGKTRRASPGALAWGLALFLILHGCDSLHNMAYLAPSALLGGSLVGVFSGRRSARLDTPPADGPGDQPGPDTRLPLLITLVVLAVVELLGRSARPSAPPSTAPALEASPAEGRP